MTDFANDEVEKLRAEIERLKEEIQSLKEGSFNKAAAETVIVPEQFKTLFEEAERNVHNYFSNADINPDNAEIIIHGERYVLMRSAAISYEFLDVFKELYSNRSEEDAIRIGNNFLFDIAHVLGKEDAKAFHAEMKVKDPVQKLSAGPVHFAYTGWANVEILPESNPSPDENFFLKYYHHNSFEAQSWIKAGRKSSIPVCIMNAGYSSGWCEESFGLPLTAVEIACEASGAEHCTFIMAPPDKIEKYLEKEDTIKDTENYDIPVFFQRKYNEDQLKESLLQKETLLKEVHHRVKNNLQIVASLLSLQQGTTEDIEVQKQFTSSILRVNTMAKIHEMIYGDRDLNAINMQKYFTKLIRSMGQVYGSQLNKVKLDLKIETDDLVLLPDKAIPLGLIVNEIATNSFKYAFDDGGNFHLRLAKGSGEHEYVLQAGDDGKGLPKNLVENTLGLSLIEILCDQIDANLKVESNKSGLTYEITFKK